jgi:tetratricopeptide (TPR) repeat protein
MLARFLSTLPALAAIVLAAAVMAVAPAIADDNGTSPHVSSLEALRQTCRASREGPSAAASTDAQEIIAHAQELIARRDRALAACTRLIDSGQLAGGELAAIFLDRGDILAPGSGEAYARALADYGRAIALMPTAAAAFSKRGQAHLLYARDLRQALRDLDIAVRLDPSQADFLVTRASIQAWLKEPAKALADLDRAVALAPAFERARSVRGLTHLDQGNFAQAIADFDEAVRLAPNSNENYSFRAAAKRAAGDQDGARADETKARELTSPSNTPAQR